MRLAVLGLGLIGGSVARALAARDPGGWRVAAWSRHRPPLEAALRDGVIELAAREPAEAIEGSELVLLAASPLGNLALVGRIGSAVAAAGATLSDVTSTQRAIAARAAAIDGLRFVGGHPMAGRERRGYAAAEADLFVGRPWLVLPGSGAGAADLERVERLARACGAVPRRIDAETHDRLVAAISHLPLLASVALAEAVLGGPDWPAARALAAGGWRDMTRIARGDAEMSAGIAASNADILVEYLDRLEARLGEWRTALLPPEGPDEALLRERFERVRAAISPVAGADDADANGGAGDGA